MYIDRCSNANMHNTRLFLTNSCYSCKSWDYLGKLSTSVRPGNIGFPVKSSAKMQPTLHKSTPTP